jgi:hypothetical protein
LSPSRPDQTKPRRTEVDLCVEHILDELGFRYAWEREALVFPGRAWRFDYAVPSKMLALEIEGGTYVPGGGRHQRRRGFQEDIHKYAMAVAQGWAVFRFTPQDIRDGTALEFLELWKRLRK